MLFVFNLYDLLINFNSISFKGVKMDILELKKLSCEYFKQCDSRKKKKFVKNAPKLSIFFPPRGSWRADDV